MSAALDAAWTPICRVDELMPEFGVAALLGDLQIAVFRTHDDQLFALDNRDPWTGANVLSRGIIGSRDGAPTVASPIHKQVFELTTGRCLQDPAMSVNAYAVRVTGGVVEVAGP